MQTTISNIFYYHNITFFRLRRNKHKIEAVASVLLAILVAVLGYWLLLSDFYKDFWIFAFCFVLAGCQFSLIKVRRYFQILLDFIVC